MTVAGASATVTLRQKNQLVGDAALCRGAVRFSGRFRLLDPGAAALDKHYQHNNKQNSCNYANNRGTVHCYFLPLIKKSNMRFKSLWNQGATPSFGVVFPGLRNCRTAQRHPNSQLRRRRHQGNTPR